MNFRKILDALELITISLAIYLLIRIHLHPEYLKPIVICPPYTYFMQDKIKELSNPITYFQAHEYFEHYYQNLLNISFNRSHSVINESYITSKKIRK